MTEDTAPATLYIDRSALPKNPVESTALRMRTMEARNGVTPRGSLRAGHFRSRHQPYATREEDARKSQGLG